MFLHPLYQLRLGEVRGNIACPIVVTNKASTQVHKLCENSIGSC
jgi:hypothetical protein